MSTLNFENFPRTVSQPPALPRSSTFRSLQFRCLGGHGTCSAPGPRRSKSHPGRDSNPRPCACRPATLTTHDHPSLPQNSLSSYASTQHAKWKTVTSAAFKLSTSSSFRLQSIKMPAVKASVKCYSVRICKQEPYTAKCIVSCLPTTCKPNNEISQVSTWWIRGDLVHYS